MSPFTPTAPPHVAERRVVHHLVGTPDTPTSGASHPAPLPDLAAGWRDLLLGPSTPAELPGRVLVAAPTGLAQQVIAVVAPLCATVTRWDGHTPGPAPDLLVGALPWQHEHIGDVPGLPGPLDGRAPAVLPLTFGARSVTVGPVTGAGGACTRCVVPVVGDAAERPVATLAPALFAFAAGTTGLFLRAIAARDATACSISLTFDLSAPHIEHRLWSCSPACRRAA